MAKGSTKKKGRYSVRLGTILANFGRHASETGKTVFINMIMRHPKTGAHAAAAAAAAAALLRCIGNSGTICIPTHTMHLCAAGKPVRVKGSDGMMYLGCVHRACPSSRALQLCITRL